MTGSQLFFSVINFVILFSALYLFMGKGAVRAVREHREKFAGELRKAEEARSGAVALTADIERAVRSNRERQAEILAHAMTQAEANSQASLALSTREAEAVLESASGSELPLRQEMEERVGVEAVKRVTSLAENELKQDTFAASRQALVDEFIDGIQNHVVAMPSDILNMKEMKKLNVTISSAEPLTDEEMHKLTRILSEKFITCRNEADEGVIDGVRIQVGDTVYDGTLSSSLERLDQDVEQQMLRSDSRMRTARRHWR